MSAVRGGTEIVWDNPSVIQRGAEVGWSRQLPMIVRITSHSAVWIAIVTPMVVVLSKGWIAGGDDAAIAIRSSQTLSLHPPLVGMYSTAANSLGHPLFDPGPLLFWLLAVPVHIDPTHGLLWGAALVCGAALSLAIEAAWSTTLWLGCVAVAFAAVDLLWRVPVVVEHLSWNAYFPIPFLIATIVLAWVVGMGSLGWWPALVFVASVAAQCHLIFVLPAVLLALLAPVLGWMATGRPDRLRWLAVGVLVGAACWLAPLIQNFRTNGNLTALLHNNAGEKTLGLSFGLKMLAAAGAPWPIWLRREPSGFYDVFRFVSGNSPAWGVATATLLAAIAVLARRRNRPLSILSLVGLVCSLSLVLSFTIYPVRNLVSVLYLICTLWVVGIVVWIAVVWAAVVGVSALLRRYRWGPVPADVAERPRRPAALPALIAIGAVVLTTIAGLWSLRSVELGDSVIGWAPNDTVVEQRVAHEVEHLVPRGPVVVQVTTVPSNSLSSLWIPEGVAWILMTDGWQPGLPPIGEAFTGLHPLPGSAAVHVTVDGTRIVAVQHAG